MTFIEEACHTRASELWQMRPDLHDWRSRIFAEILRYSEISAVEPTSSASIVLFRHVAAAAASVLRKKAPAVLEWKAALASEPQLLNRKMSQFLASAEDEIHVHQIVVARLLKLSPERIR